MNSKLEAKYTKYRLPGMEDVIKAIELSDKNLFREDMRDNLFKANHRGLMMKKYGYTEAMRVTVGELV